MISVVAKCFIEECEREEKTRGMCKSHYEKWLRCGDPLGQRPLMVQGTNEERFWAKVDKRGPDECWEWLAAKDSYGYGIFSYPRPDKGRYMNMLAHRFSWNLHGGNLPIVAKSGSNEETIDHVVCRNRACVNPAHMEIVTSEENSRRAALSRGVPEQLLLVALAILPYRGQKPTTRAIAEELDTTPRRCRIALQKMEQRGEVRLVNPGRWGFWELVMEEAAA